MGTLHVIINVSDDGLLPSPHGDDVHLISVGRRPTVIYANYEKVEKELARLAQQHSGTFVLFEATAMARVVKAPTHVNIKGEVLRTENVVRVVAINAEEDDAPPF